MPLHAAITEPTTAFGEARLGGCGSWPVEPLKLQLAVD
jgi:hypothetical protein